MGPQILPEFKNKVFMPIDGATHSFDKQAFITEFIIKFPAVICRRHFDHLIQFDNADEPRLHWKIESLSNMDEYCLRELRRWLENKFDLEGKLY